MKGSIKRYCSCINPATGRQYSASCPTLAANDKHGQWGYRDRLLTTAGNKPFQRRSFRTKTAATDFQRRVYKLLDLAQGDVPTLKRIGDLIFERTKRGGLLPPVEDVRRRLGVGHPLDRSRTVGELLEEFIASKKRAKKTSTVRLYRQHIDHYLKPQLGHLPADRCNALHISDMFDQIAEWNEEIEQAAKEGRAPLLDGDLRQRPKVVGPATQRRVYATLRNFFNWLMRQKPTPLVDYNPTSLVEMPPEFREPVRTWDPEQVSIFLEATASDPLHFLYRLVLLHGPRRGEAVGARKTGFDGKAMSLQVLRPLLMLGGHLHEEKSPKTRAGVRVLFLDEDTAAGIQAVIVQNARNKLQWGAAYQDDDLIWCREDGSPYSPEFVSRHFKDLARAAGLPPIKLHEGRHTAATLRLEAGTDIKVVSEQLGHSKTGITRDLYQHVRRAMLDKATASVVELLPKKGRSTQRKGQATG